MFSAFPRESTQGSRETDENGVGDLYDLPEWKYDEQVNALEDMDAFSRHE